MGCLRTILLGIAGSFVGGLVGYVFRGGELVQSSGWLGSVVGAITLLAICIKRGKFIE